MSDVQVLAMERECTTNLNVNTATQRYGGYANKGRQQTKSNSNTISKGEVKVK